MTPEEAVLARIVTLNTTAGSRVYQLRLEQQATLPAVRVQLIDDLDAYHLRGGAGLKRSRVQVDAFAVESSGGDPYATAQLLADEINGDDAGSGLSGFAGFVQGAGSPGLDVAAIVRVFRRAEYESAELRQVRIQQDYIVHYWN